MVARSENIDRTVEEEEEEGTWSTNCLMLLTRVGRGGESRRFYRCKTCTKRFSSFQALGGHRASHNKHIHAITNDINDHHLSWLSSGSNVNTMKKTKKTRSHTCPICRLNFNMGQALGGHMRKHSDEKHSGGALVTRSLFPKETTTQKLISTDGKRVACYDSSLDRDDEVDAIDLKLTLGIC